LIREEIFSKQPSNIQNKIQKCKNSLTSVSGHQLSILGECQLKLHTDKERIIVRMIICRKQPSLPEFKTIGQWEIFSKQPSNIQNKIRKCRNSLKSVRGHQLSTLGECQLKLHTDKERIIVRMIICRKQPFLPEFKTIGP